MTVVSCAVVLSVCCQVMYDHSIMCCSVVLCVARLCTTVVSCAVVLSCVLPGDV